jgi:ABC-type molybdate transport system substrate-binding protein
LLTDRIESGEPYDLLASADMEHPLQLRKDGHAAAVVMFARNALCAFATPEAGLDADNFAARLLDPAVKLGTSTPKADPSGDYTWKMFGLIDKQRPGAAATLEAKADKVIGGAVPAASAGNPIASAFQRGEINVMIGYCSGAEQLKRDVAGLQVVRVPAPFAVGSDYGLAIRALDKPAALGLALAILSPEGQATLARYGFAPVGLPSAP